MSGPLGALPRPAPQPASAQTMQLPVQLAGQRRPVVVDVPAGCQTLQDVADALEEQLDEGTWIELDHDDVEVGAGGWGRYSWVLAVGGHSWVLAGGILAMQSCG